MGTEFVLRGEGLRVVLFSATFFYNTQDLQELKNLQNISLQLFAQVLWLLLFRRLDCKMNIAFFFFLLGYNFVFCRHLLKKDLHVLTLIICFP